MYDQGPFSELSDRARKKVEQFYTDGVEYDDIMQDMTVFFNMYKSRYTNILPINFRHQMMYNMTKLIDELVTPYVDLM